MIDVFQIPIDKNRLKAMPKEERALFLQLGYAANQLNLLTKLVIISTNKTPAEQPEQSLSGAQSQMLARILIAQLWETYRLINDRFLSSPLGKEFIPLLDKGGQDALTSLKKNFGNSNILSKLRNEHIFHNPSIDDVDSAFQVAVSDPQWDKDWNWFFSMHNHNSFYFMSDVVFMHGMLQAAGETNLVKAQEKIMGEVRQVSQDLMQFIMALTAAFWKKHFGSEMSGKVVANIKDAPNLFELWLPFYVEIPAEEPAL